MISQLMQISIGFYVSVDQPWNKNVAGGVALNSVANGRILRETPFEDLFIHPAPGDSGGAVGAALYVWHVLLGKPRQFTLEHAYLGREYNDGEIGPFWIVKASATKHSMMTKPSLTV